MEYEAALKHFKKVDPILYAAAKNVRNEISRRGEIRSNQALFEALCASIVSQQLAVKAADAIWERVKKACGGKVTPEAIIKTRLPSLRAAGLSAAKAKTLKELAKEIQNGLKLSALRKKSQKEAEEILTAIWGIGPWTCEMFLMFGLSHPDIFSSRDLGLVRSMETLYQLPRQTSREELEVIALRWSPHRTLACRILWKSRDKKKTLAK